MKNHPIAQEAVDGIFDLVGLPEPFHDESTSFPSAGRYNNRAEVGLTVTRRNDFLLSQMPSSLKQRTSRPKMQDSSLQAHTGRTDRSPLSPVPDATASPMGGW